MSPWTLADMPSQRGRLAIVTGGAGGLGFETALELARAGASVIVAGRNATKGDAAVGRIMAAVPDARVRFAPLDLASLSSVADFAEARLVEGAPIDLLVNNAGIMMLPRRQTTEDGFERQFGVNYLGHFALTGRLLPLLRAAHASGAPARIVNLSSIVAQRGAIELDDLQASQHYRPTRAYAQSKLAMLMMAMELERRSLLRGWNVLGIAAHPGWARTDLIANGPGGGGFGIWRLAPVLAPIFGQSAAEGAWPILYAAAAPEAKGGGYYGPAGFLELAGPPGPAKFPPQSHDSRVAERLWDISERLTGVAFRAQPRAPGEARAGSSQAAE